MTIDEKIKLAADDFKQQMDRNNNPNVFSETSFNLGVNLTKSEMLADMQPLLMAISKSKDDFWFMQTLLERTNDDKYLRDAVNDCIERMKFRKPMFENALADFNAKYKGLG